MNPPVTTDVAPATSSVSTLVDYVEAVVKSNHESIAKRSRDADNAAKLSAQSFRDTLSDYENGKLNHQNAKYKKRKSGMSLDSKTEITTGLCNKAIETSFLVPNLDDDITAALVVCLNQTDDFNHTEQRTFDVIQVMHISFLKLTKVMMKDMQGSADKPDAAAACAAATDAINNCLAVSLEYDADSKNEVAALLEYEKYKVVIKREGRIAKDAYMRALRFKAVLKNSI